MIRIPLGPESVGANMPGITHERGEIRRRTTGYTAAVKQRNPYVAPGLKTAVTLFVLQPS